MAPSGVRKIAIYVDGQFAAYPAMHVPRPDVARAFPGASGALQSGWQTLLDASGLSAAPHRIVVVAESAGGGVVTTDPVTVVV